MALGAGAADLFRRVISRSLRLTAVGVLGGRDCGAGIDAMIRNAAPACQSEHVSPNDPLAFGLAVAVMMITSVGVCLLPGRPRLPIPPECCQIDPYKGEVLPAVVLRFAFLRLAFCPIEGSLASYKESQPGIVRRFTHDMSR